MFFYVKPLCGITVDMNKCDLTLSFLLFQLTTKSNTQKFYCIHVIKNVSLHFFLTVTVAEPKSNVNIIMKVMEIATL